MKITATRQFDALCIRYELLDYGVGHNDLSAVKFAHEVGLAISQVFKTLCAKGDRHGVAFAAIRGETEPHLEFLARVLPWRCDGLGCEKALISYQRNGGVDLRFNRPPG